jgi:hypothetical protein
MGMCLRGSGVLVLLICAMLCGTGFCAVYGGGTGSSGDPYLISTDAHLGELSGNSGDWSQCFKLVADVNATLYTPVGTSAMPFTGVFDGDGYSISGFVCTTGASYVGFFGKVQGSGACVKNLNLFSPNINVSGADNVGAIAGSVVGGVISGCSVTGGSVTGRNQTGGIVGTNSGTVTYCFASATVNGNSQVGGLEGLNDMNASVSRSHAEGSVTARIAESGISCGGLIGVNKGTVTECVATGSATGASNIGGLVGYNYYSNSSSKIQQSYASGEVSGTSYVGGLVGYNNTNPIVTMCYSRGPVSGTSYVGGLIGWSKSAANITRSFWDTTASGQPTSPFGGAGKTTEQMKQIGTFTIAGVAWDFMGETTNGTADIWRMCVDGVYPRLSWEFQRSDVACPDGVEFIDFATLASCWSSGGCSDIDMGKFAAEWLTGF